MILCRKTVIFAKITQLFTLNKEEKERTVNEEEIVLTPMMKQFLDLKAQHPDAVMLFRCGDFYETYSTGIAGKYRRAIVGRPHYR